MNGLHLYSDDADWGRVCPKCSSTEIIDIRWRSVQCQQCEYRDDVSEFEHTTEEHNQDA